MPDPNQDPSQDPKPNPPLDGEAKRRLAVIRHVEEVTGNVAQSCRYFGISRQAHFDIRTRADHHELCQRAILAGRRTLAGHHDDHAGSEHRHAKSEHDVTGADADDHSADAEADTAAGSFEPVVLSRVSY